MDELGRSIPSAEAMVDAEHSTKGKRYNENCLNCGTKLEDSFCPHCGQKDIPRRQGLGELFGNFITSFLNYEGKFLKTTRKLILKPGSLALEYNAGKRESYFHPARMYVFISFIFFLLFFSLPDEEKKDKNDGFNISSTEDKDEDEIDDVKLDSLINSFERDTMLNKVVPGLKDSISKQIDGNRNGKKKKNRGFGMSINQKEYKTIQAYDSAQNALPEAERDGWFERKLNERVIEIGARYKGDWTKFGQDFGGAFKDNFSKILFFLLPIFALLLKALYMRRDYYYSEHVVFTIYYYNFFYLAASVQMLVEQVPYVGWVGTLIGFWIFFYLLFAMKGAYGQGWGKTIAKFAIFTFVFFWVAMVALSVTAMAILMVI